MSKLAVTDFSKRTGSPFQSKTGRETENSSIVHEEVFEKVYERQKEKQSELQQKVNKKTAEIQANKPSDGFFTEVVTHGAFTSKANNNGNNTKTSTKLPVAKTTAANNTSIGSKTSLLGFPSSANDLALDAKSDLESDPNISKEVKDKVIEKLFALASISQHIYESKVRIMTEFEKFKDVHLKAEGRREKEHAEQLYKLNMNFQSEVVQAIQRLKSELDISSNVTKSVEDNESVAATDNSMEFNTNEESQDTVDNSESVTKGNVPENNNVIE
ncbi:hypothetical protein JYU34_019406 [Plutella xylostella]|uniref:Uncharacterized protein n=1 Tax=Plutella xylostella TaxID=51655 RepID=A0ABQ7PWR3_PLUXY|nr:hypothetical protein JYU34_019406 [Plutella xylostella]